MFISPVFIVLCQVLLSLNPADGAAVGTSASPPNTGDTSPPAGKPSTSTHVILDYGDFQGKAEAGIESWSGLPYVRQIIHNPTNPIHRSIIRVIR